MENLFAPKDGWTSETSPISNKMCLSLQSHYIKHFAAYFQWFSCCFKNVLTEIKCILLPDKCRVHYCNQCGVTYKQCYILQFRWFQNPDRRPLGAGLSEGTYLSMSSSEKNRTLFNKRRFPVVTHNAFTFNFCICIHKIYSTRETAYICHLKT